MLETAHTFDLEPRSLEQQEAWIAERGALGVVVAERDGVVAGFASLSPYRPRAAYRTTVENSVYVDEAARGSGVGAPSWTSSSTWRPVAGSTPSSPTSWAATKASIGLHHACGFQVVGTEREVGRKFGRWLDVVVMQRMLPDDPPPRSNWSSGVVDSTTPLDQFVHVGREGFEPS
ncbi:MAG: N-acetyltransferase family protein [Acidimicrobiales bacterium]